MTSSLAAFFFRKASAAPAPKLTAHQQGEADFDRGVKLNPYPAGTAQAAEWEAGRQDAHHAQQW